MLPPSNSSGLLAHTLVYYVHINVPVTKLTSAVSFHWHGTNDVHQRQRQRHQRAQQLLRDARNAADRLSARAATMPGSVRFARALCLCASLPHSGRTQSQLLEAPGVRPAASASARAVRAASASVRPQQSRNALEPLLLMRGRALYRPTSSLVFSLEVRDACAASARRTLGSSVYSVHSLLDQLHAHPPSALSAPPAPASPGESSSGPAVSRTLLVHSSSQLQLHRHQPRSHTSLTACRRRGRLADGCAASSSGRSRRRTSRRRWW